MTVVPIWKFADVIDPIVGERIESAIKQDAEKLQHLLGDNNFFDTLFKAGDVFSIISTNKIDNLLNFDRTNDKKSYIRNSNYTYIYNPNELKNQSSP